MEFLLVAAVLVAAAIVIWALRRDRRLGAVHKLAPTDVGPATAGRANEATVLPPPPSPAADTAALRHRDGPWSRSVDVAPPQSVEEQAPPTAPILISPPASRKRRGPRQARITKKSKLLFLDVETTGLSADDRIVSLGMARIHAEDLLKIDPSGSHGLNAEIVHLVFNPERPNHPAAQRVHGWSDDILARQPCFAAHASTIVEMLEGSDVWLAHNVSFDLRFIESELRRLDLSPARRPTFCTMDKAKSEWPGETSRLDHCIGRIGLSRSGARHGALEDAILCAALFTYFRAGTKLDLPQCPPPSNIVH